MRFLYSGIFWGFIIILFGIGILLKSIFHINIPFFKILVGIIVIFLGISIIFNAINSRKYTAVLGNHNFRSASFEKEYNIIFSKGNIDFNNLDFSNYNGEVIKINSVFSSSEIYINKNFEYEIRASSMFGVIRMPNGENVSFGNIARLENTGKSELKKINLEVSSVFSEVKILYK